MPLIAIDDLGRMTIPKEIGVKNLKAIIVPAGSFFITIPLAKNSKNWASCWLPTTKRNRELTQEAESEGREDAVDRAKRRKQL